MLFGRVICENPFKSVMNTRTKKGIPLGVPFLSVGHRREPVVRPTTSQNCEPTAMDFGLTGSKPSAASGRYSEWPRSKKSRISGRAMIFSGTATGVPMRAAQSCPVTATTSEQTLHRLLRLFQKTERAHAAAPPFQPRPACAGLAPDDKTYSPALYRAIYLTLGR